MIRTSRVAQPGRCAPFATPYYNGSNRFVWRFANMTAPDWLVQRGNALKLGSDGKTWFVLCNQQPNYSLAAVPVSGKFGCVIRQTINGKRIECPGMYPTAEEALRAGVDNLGEALGWK